MDILQPPLWLRPKGYSNGIVTTGRMVFVSGMLGWDANQQFRSNVFVDQAAQALRNALAVLAEAGGGHQDVVRMTWYIVNRDEYILSAKALGGAYREVMGDHYPAMTIVAVAALMEPAARVEIEITAVIPQN